MKKMFRMIIGVIIIVSGLMGTQMSVMADNPYNYSGEPTRAIYYVVPTMRGEDVKWVQCALNEFGNYGLAIDGSFGPACKEATKKFQAAMGMTQDGSFGPATRATMVNWLNSRNQPATPAVTQTQPQTSLSDNPYNYSGEPSRAIYYVLPTMKGNDVKWVQSALNCYGNYGLAVDGSFGPACREATKKFQASMGMTQDGSFGPATRQKMIEWLSGKVNTSTTNTNVTNNTISPSGKAAYKQGKNGCYTASAAMIMTNLGGSWNGQTATYDNVVKANGNTVYFNGSTPGLFGCSRWDINASKSSVIDAIKTYPQGVMVAFREPAVNSQHCMVAVGLNSAGEPLFYDPVKSDVSNGGNGYTLEQTSATTWGGANWGTIMQVSIITK